jgi:hypothetical protein
MFTGIATWIAKSVIGGWLTKIGAAIAWLFKAWYRIAIAVLLGVCIFLYVGKQAETRRADKQTEVADKWESAYVLVIEAQRLATIAAEKNKARVIAEYREINDEAEQDYERRIADSRAALQRWLQNRGSSASQGDGSTKPEMPAPTVPNASEAFVSVRIEDLEIAADNYAQLVSLIAWAEKIGYVNTEEVVIP